MPRPILTFACALCAILPLAGALASEVAAPPPQLDSHAQRDPGVTLRVYSIQQEPQSIPELAPDQTPNADELRPTVDFRGAAGFLEVPSPIYATVTGWIEAPVDGAYRFRLVSDDGSRLRLGGRTIVDNDGRHGERARASDAIDLDAGLHEFLIEYFDHVGQRMLRLEWQPPEEVRTAPGFVTIPTTALWAERDLTRVTSPGFKRLSDGLRAGDGLPVAGVHPSWDLSTIRPEGFEPMVGAMAFLPDGRLVIGTFSPLQRDERVLPDIESKVPDRLYALANVHAGDPTQVIVSVIADDLYEPAGLCVVDGNLYVSQRREITRLRDLTGDGFLETHERVGHGWDAWNYHEFTRGLVHHDGTLYAALTTVMAPPAWEGMETNSGPSGPLRGTIVAIDLSVGDGPGSVRAIAGGTRTPNGIGMIPALESDPTAAPILLYTDNQGTWMAASQLSEVIPGRFYGHYNWTRVVPNLAERFRSGGHPSAFSDRPRTPATLFLPQNEVVNSPTQPLAIEDGIFAGQILIGELTAGGVRRAFLERVNGELQGALFRFTQGLEAGVNTLVRGPDGALYIGGMGAGGNWNWRGTRHGLQRLAPNGRLAFEMHSVSVRHDGLVVRFTKPVSPQWLAESEHYRISQWRYAPTAEYGGPKVGTERLHVRSATPADDGLSVRLTIDGMREGSCVHLRTDPTSVDGEEIWSTEAWYTLNAIPKASSAEPARIGDMPIDPERTGIGGGLGVGATPPADAAILIGRTGWDAMRFERRREAPPTLTQDDLIEATGEVEVGFGSGDLVSPTVFGDARIHIEFHCPPGGVGQLAANSGVYVQERYELQVLGTTPDQPPRNDELGAIYGVRAPDRNASTGPGTWQAYDIWFRAPRFVDGEKTEDARMTVYLNGTLIHDDAAVAGPTGAARAGSESPVKSEGPSHQVGPLRFQDHASQAEGPVRYRNVWIAPLEPMDAPGARSGPWLDLLDRTVTDWTPRGGAAEFRIVDEPDAQTGEPHRVAVGTSRPQTPNTFLTTTERFGDFELIYEAKTHERLNSGVQIRSDVIGGIENRNGGLRGYQIELDPSPRAFSAGIYDEARRGWLHPLHGNPAARRAFKPGDWNTFHVIARGPLVQTWINGVPAATIHDAMDTDGHIGLQVHGVGDAQEPLEVRFRNVRLRTLE